MGSAPKGVAQEPKKRPLKSLFSSYPFFSHYFAHDIPLPAIAHKVILPPIFFLKHFMKVPPDFSMLSTISHIEITELKR